MLREKDFDNESKANRIHGFCGQDFSEKDFRHLSIKFLYDQSFDGQSEWASIARLPKGFDPEQILETSKDPGLGIKRLHRAGITGRGISVAVIDKPINPNHKEFLGRIIYHPILTSADAERYRLHFHGMSCASILCGSSCGVAPEATLYYFAVPDDGNNSVNYCTALRELLRVNDKLPRDQKIRIVSISDGIDKNVRREWISVFNEAKKQNVVVNFPGGETLGGFTWGGCPPDRNKDDPEQYRRAIKARKLPNHAKRIILPADYRTTAGNEDPLHFIYWGGDSGFSWATAYFAGLATLAWSIDSDISINEILTYIETSKTRTSSKCFVVNPVAFIDMVKRNNKE